MKDKQIKELTAQVKSFEQQLIDANLEIAQVRTKYAAEQALVAKIKTQMENQGDGQQMAFDYTDPLTPEIADHGRSKKRTTTFLKMFRFDKARTPRNQNNNQQPDEMNQSSLADQSIDYANYLLEI